MRDRTIEPNGMLVGVSRKWDAQHSRWRTVNAFHCLERYSDNTIAQTKLASATKPIGRNLSVIDVAMRRPIDAPKMTLRSLRNKDHQSITSVVKNEVETNDSKV